MNNIVVTNQNIQDLGIGNVPIQNVNMKNSHEIKVVSLDGVIYKAGDNISIEDDVISVITTNEVESDNTRPITSAGVDTVVGNINVLLETI